MTHSMRVVSSPPPMPAATSEATHDDDPVALLSAHINPRLAQVPRLIGFDKRWHRARGAFLWDGQGTEYLDLLTGYGVFNLGCNHPRIRDALMDHLASEAPSLVQFEAPLLAGRLAQRLSTIAWSGSPSRARATKASRQP